MYLMSCFEIDYKWQQRFFSSVLALNVYLELPFVSLILQSHEPLCSCWSRWLQLKLLQCLMVGPEPLKGSAGLAKMWCHHLVVGLQNAASNQLSDTQSYVWHVVMVNHKTTELITSTKKRKQSMKHTTTSSLLVMSSEVRCHVLHQLTC